MQFETKYDGHTCTASFWQGRATFRCDFLAGKDFDSVEKMEAAIKAHDLSLRKNFKNTTAYTTGDYNQDKNKVYEVKVTSVDGEHAWTTTAKGRTKRRLASLYADKAELESAMSAVADLEKQIKAVWSSVRQWDPECSAN